MPSNPPTIRAAPPFHQCFAQSPEIGGLDADAASHHQWYRFQGLKCVQENPVGDSRKREAG
jgi:hypothetical protein